MKIMWCWRCKADMPMLDEQEWSRLAPLLSVSLSATKAYRERTGSPLQEATDVMRAAYEPARAEYHRITGFREENEVALWHHRISLYGPPCSACGRLLRTPAAKHCAACGAPARGP